MADCDDLIATVRDLERMIRRSIETPEELATVKELLLYAASAIRNVTGNPFGTMVVERTLPVRDGIIWLNENDVSAVTWVKTVTGVLIDSTWDGLHRVSIGASINIFDVEGTVADNVLINYTRTGSTAPPWVVGMCAQMAARAFGRPADQSGVQQESIAGYSYSVGSAAAAGAIGMLPDELKRLKNAYPRIGSTAYLGVLR